MATITPGVSTAASTGTQAVINTTASTTTSTSAATSKADELKNQFLSILLTQLQNQNPLDPMDTKEFTGQLAQFSSLEQQIDTNSKLDSLLSNLQTNATTSAFTYIGKNATIMSNMTAYQGGEADWDYSLPKDAKSVKISVLDQNGTVLFQTTQGKMNAGAYGFKMSASDFTTQPAEGAILTLKIDAADADGKAIASTVQTTVTIDGIETTDDGVDMRAGNLLFGMADIVKVSTPKVTTPVVASTSDTTGTTTDTNSDTSDNSGDTTDTDETPEA